MPILQIRDEDGNFIPIPAIKGDKGKSAYEQAKEGGYKGTEEEFIAILNGLTSPEDTEHREDFNNPHKVTASQLGAVQIKTDVYIGNGNNSQFIDLGFTPEMVLIFGNHATEPIFDLWLGTVMAIKSYSVDFCEIKENGFIAKYSSTAGHAQGVNSTGMIYPYAAFGIIEHSSELGVVSDDN